MIESTTQKELEKIEAIEKESRAVECPSCGERLKFMVRTNIIGMRVSGSPAGSAEDDKVHYLREAEMRVINQAREQGVLDPFLKACEQVSRWSPPADFARFFVTFMRSCSLRSEPTWKLRILFDENIGGHLVAYSHSQIVMIVADDNIKMFIPMELFTGEIARKVQIGQKGTSVSKTDINDWVRTRFGYVAGKGAFYSALQAECTAIWGNASRKQRK